MNYSKPLLHLDRSHIYLPALLQVLCLIAPPGPDVFVSNVSFKMSKELFSYAPAGLLIMIVMKRKQHPEKKAHIYLLSCP